MSEKRTNEKKPREKPISLYPLSLDEALTELLKSPPMPKDDKKQPTKKERTSHD
jgi:hypothetical protein